MNSFRENDCENNFPYLFLIFDNLSGKKTPTLFSLFQKMYAINSQTTCTGKVVRALEVTVNVVTKTLLTIGNDRRFSAKVTTLQA